MNLQFRKICRKPYRALRLYGVLGTFRLVIEQLPHYLLGRKAAGRSPQPRSAFDQMWNVCTDGNENLSELHLIDDRNSLYGTRYEPTEPEIFRKVTEAVHLPYEKCIFIDCGSGKGRVLLMASDLPFRRIIGVEFSTELTAIAQANIREYRSPTQRCKQLEAVCMDATGFPFPPEPTVLYLYNPFGGQVMEAFLRHVENSLSEHPREFYVLYRNPMRARLWDQSKHFVKVTSSDLFAIYKSSFQAMSASRPEKRLA